MLVEGATVAWVGSDSAASTFAESGDLTVVDLAGALVTPAFVDAHVHCLDTGLQHIGVDLASATTVTDILDRVRATANRRPGATITGHGWDEAALHEQRPPTIDELSLAGGGSPVYLSRIDVHSAVVSWSLADAAGLTSRTGWSPSGLVRADAHHAARAAARTLTPDERREAHLAALRAAAQVGIGYLHEMSGPDLVGLDDLAPLLLIAREVGVRVIAYWAALAADQSIAQALATSGATAEIAGLGGDLCVDGSIGSRTAAMREAYIDGREGDDHASGRLYLSAADVAGHVTACGIAGVQAGFHVIGDAGLDAVLDGLDEVAGRHGAAVVRRARVRLEHVETADDDQIARLAGHGATASVQPAFDAIWGGPEGMYRRRLGEERGGRLNRFASMAAAGVPLAMGSDSPVTPFDPWGAVAAATSHFEPGERISARAAFAAHTRGAHRAAGGLTTGEAAPTGVLAPGAVASFAVWNADQLVVWAPDDRVQAWSTDPRSGTAPLPDVSGGRERPACLRTVVDGIVVFDAGVLP